MHYVLSPFGSVGDVNPFLALGQELLRRGVRVTLLANGYFADAVQRAGLGYIELGTKAEYLEAAANPLLWSPMRALRLILSECVAVLMRQHYQHLESLQQQEPIVAVSNLFVSEARVMKMGAPRHPHPIYRLPTSHFGFGIAAVAVGIGLSTVDALEALALSKKLPPPRDSLADQQSVQYAVGKARALVEAAHATSRDAGVRVWNEVCENGEASMGARAYLRRAIIHAVDSCIEAVSLCYREAGGSAVFESAPFERAVRDIHAIGGHAVVQGAMMQDAGRCALGMKALSPLF